MPRLIDKLDAAAGRVPEVLDDGADYRTLRPSPERLVRKDGTYDAGWYERFDGALNFDDSSSFSIALQRWFHLSLDAGDRFIVCNLADLSKAANVAVLVVDKVNGRFTNRSLTRVLPTNNLDISDDLCSWKDGETGSFLKVSPDLTRFDFSIRADDLHVAGAARHILGPPLVQVTRFQRGRGSLQWYGNLELEHGVVAVDGVVHPLPPGSMGLYDRTAGHQRGISAWNWIAASGVAEEEGSGRRVRMGIQVARDRTLARPQVHSHKNLVWVDDRLYKLPTPAFEYEVLSEETRDTGPWRIVSEDGAGGRWDLTFRPDHHRRDRQQLWLVEGDFNQHYGAVSGVVTVDNRRFIIRDWFAVCEESLLEL